MEAATGVRPPALAEKPELREGGRAVLGAYDLIDQSRLFSEYGPQAIQVAEILAYLEIARIERGEDRLLFLSTIKTLDVIYMNHYAEQHKK